MEQFKLVICVGFDLWINGYAVSLSFDFYLSGRECKKVDIVEYV
jgi:hypothetical protein